MATCQTICMAAPTSCILRCKMAWSNDDCFATVSEGCVNIISAWEVNDNLQTGTEFSFSSVLKQNTRTIICLFNWRLYLFNCRGYGLHDSWIYLQISLFHGVDRLLEQLLLQDETCLKSIAELNDHFCHASLPQITLLADTKSPKYLLY